MGSLAYRISVKAVKKYKGYTLFGTVRLWADVT
jgi:hypothetical protein